MLKVQITFDRADPYSSGAKSEAIRRARFG